MLNQEQQKIFSSLTPNARVRLFYADVRDPVWIRPSGDDNLLHFVDLDGEPFDPTMVAHIVLGHSDEWEVEAVEGDHVRLVCCDRVQDNGDDITMCITSAYLRDIKLIESGDRWTRRETIVPDLGYTFVQRADGILEVGCQKIGPEGQRMIVDLLAERLDLEVVPKGDHLPDAFPVLEDVVSKLYEFPTCLDELLGEELYVRVMKALGRDDVLAEREAQ